MKIKIVATTDVGLERENNEDAYLLCTNLSLQDWTSKDMPAYTSLGETGALLVVADGMGGADAGEIASDIAIESIKVFFAKEKVAECIKAVGYPAFFQQAVKVADEAVNCRIEEDLNTSGMGTTIVLCWIVDHTAHIAWCGDSRCYLYNPQKGLRLLTKDHSYVQSLVDNGVISEKAAFNHPDSNIITNGLGDFQNPAQPDVVSCELSPNDFLLVCSDGLSGYCTDEQIEHVMDDNYTDVGGCRDQLLRLALDAGGYDNISIVMASLISDTQDDIATISFASRVKRFFYRLFR